MGRSLGAGGGIVVREYWGEGGLGRGGVGVRRGWGEGGLGCRRFGVRQDKHLAKEMSVDTATGCVSD